MVGRSPMKMPQRTQTPTPVSLLLTTLALIAFVVAGCTGAPNQPGATSATPSSSRSPFEPTTTKPAQPTGPLLAYRASDEIGVVEGTTVVASVRGSFSPSNDLITTEDGKFV